MISITNKLTKIVSDAFEISGYDAKLGLVTSSDRLDLCQYQCNGALSGAKIYKKNPFVIAEEIVGILNKNQAFSKVEAIRPGFINITLTDEFIIENVKSIASDEYLGIIQPEKPQTIVIDYGGPNVAKPLHIGHLRSAIIGESLKRLARVCGNNAIGDVHLGDWGLQIGLVISELKVRNPKWAVFNDDFVEGKSEVPVLDADTLNEVYPFASAKSKSDESFKLESQKATQELQSGRSGYIALWKEIIRVSIDDLKKNYNHLNVDFDLWYGESDAEKYVDGMVEKLNNKGLLEKSEGALIVDISKEDDKAPMPPIIIKKSDNSNLYSTTDLATIVQRVEDFSPEKIWYVVDKRQELHFTQVFRCAKKAELVSDGTELEFLGFGTMNGSDGKPYKTRDGGVMRLSDLLQTVTENALEKLSFSEYLKMVSEEQKREVARKVGISAIKFGDLINHRSKDYIFDIDKFLSFEGKTGSYILYTITRINSILKKTNTEYDADLKITGVYSENERELLLKIIANGEVFSRAFEEKAPSIICENAYSLASIFSKFYHDSRIVDEANQDKRNSWLALMILTRKILLQHLDVLGIEAVENM